MTGIPAGFQFKRRHDLEERAATAAHTLHKIYVVTPNQSLRIVYANSWTGNVARVRRYVEEGEGERVGKVQAHSHTLSGDHRNWTMKFYGFGFLPSPGALAEEATGLGFQKFGSALIHSSCT